MVKINFKEELCKGCGLCAMACPKKLISLSPTRANNKGYYVAEILKPEECIGCTNCAIMCPDSVIFIAKDV